MKKIIIVMLILLIGSLSIIEANEIPEPIKEVKENGETWWSLREDRLLELLNKEDKISLLINKINSLEKKVEQKELIIMSFQNDFTELQLFMTKQENFYLKRYKKQKMFNQAFLSTGIISFSLSAGLMAGIISYAVLNYK